MLDGRNISPRLEEISADDEEALASNSVRRRSTLNRLLFPHPTALYGQAQEQYGDLSVLETNEYLYGFIPGEEYAIHLAKGVVLYVALEAIGEPDEKGVRTVMVRVNGQMRPVFVKDLNVSVDTPDVERADRSDPNQLPAPFSGTVTVKVPEGATVSAGQTVATIEAMKMEASITAPHSGVVKRLAFTGSRGVDAGDLILVIEEGE